MKKLIFKHLTIAILLFTVSNIYSQSDSGLTYFPRDISLSYYNGTMISTSITTGEKTIVYDFITIDDVKKIRFLSDSLISISNPQNTNLQLNINKIKEVSFKKGNYSGIGVIVGALSGLILGAVIGNGTAKEETGPFAGLAGLEESLIGGFFGFMGGAAIGGIIGSNIESSDDYFFPVNQVNKKEEIKRILNLNAGSSKTKLKNHVNK